MQTQSHCMSRSHTYAADRFLKSPWDAAQNILMSQILYRRLMQNHSRQTQFHLLFFLAHEDPMNISAPSTMPHCALYPPAPCKPTADRIVCGSMAISNNSLKQISVVLAQFIFFFQYKSCTRFVICSFIDAPLQKIEFTTPGTQSNLSLLSYSGISYC